MAAPDSEDPLVEGLAALVDLAHRDPAIQFWQSPFAARLPGNELSRRVSGRVVELAATGVAAEKGAKKTVLLGSTDEICGALYARLRDILRTPEATVAAIGIIGGLAESGYERAPAFEDAGRLLGLPGLQIVVPADGPTARSAIQGLFSEARGSTYLRLVAGKAPVIGDGSFEVGRARELHSGSDMTIGAVGRPLASCLQVAREFAGVGVTIRVLDLGSVKPLDTRSILRAARETGALLIVEEHPLLGGVGSQVAGLTAENTPVPVRRIGIPDVSLPSSRAEELERWGFTTERIRDEAWELLTLRGKVQ